MTQGKIDFAPIKKAAENCAPFIAEARRTARRLTAIVGDITIDDVRADMEERNYPCSWGNWMGSVFLERDDQGNRVWVCVGTRAAKHKAGNGRRVSAWRLK